MQRSLRLIVPNDGNEKPRILINEDFRGFSHVVCHRDTESYLKAFVYELTNNAFPSYAVDVVDMTHYHIHTVFVGDRMLYTPLDATHQLLLKDFVGLSVKDIETGHVSTIDGASIFDGKDILLSINDQSYGPIQALSTFDVMFDGEWIPLGVRVVDVL